MAKCKEAKQTMEEEMEAMQKERLLEEATNGPDLGAYYTPLHCTLSAYYT